MAQLTAFGRVVRIFRIKTGTTLKVMAESMGVSAAYLSGVETGSKPLTDRVVEGTKAFFSAYEGVDSREIQSAADKTIQSYDLSDMDEDGRGLVAAFARKASIASRDQRDEWRRLLEED